MTAAARLAQSLGERYRIEGELGQGGMATVYRARDLRHDRDVAIKVLHPELGAALGGERFLGEIRTTARLQHPHILPLLDSGDAGGLLFYVMPLVTGETLRARLARERQLPVADALRIAREVASALDYAHRHGVIHRDIKPENILLHDGQAQVADFGIALAVQQAGGQRLTQTGLSLGTPQYMSPEQAMGERAIDARSDIYALGAVTYEMLTGEPPFTGPTVQAIVARLMAEEPRPLIVQRKSVPEHVEAAVLRALEKVPADRFASAAELGAALDPHSAPTTRLTLTRAARGRDRRPLLALGALALASLGVAGWALTRPAPAAEVVRYRVVIDSVPAVKHWAGELAISPDGAILVRSGGPGGALSIRRRDQLTFSPLAGTEGASAPFFSADGSMIGYYANGAIAALPLAGGPPVVIADSIPTPESVSWGRDGYLYRGLIKDGSMAIVRSEARAGAPLEAVTRVDTTAGEIFHGLPELLEDGRTLLFQVGYRDGRRMIAAADVESGRHTVMMPGTRARYAGGQLVYPTSDGKLWAQPFDLRTRTTSGAATQVGDRIPTTVVGPVDFALSATGTLAYSVEDVGARRELTWVTRAGKREPVDSTWKGEFASPTLSPDGSRIVVAVRDKSQSELWVKPAVGGAPTRLGVEHRNSVEPAWSPDGRWVSYLAGPASANTGDVWRQRADGVGAAERLARSARPLSEQIWGPVSGALLMRTTTPTPGAGDILVLRPGVDREPVPLVASPRTEYSPVVSPDGKWLAYVADETGRFEVYVTPFGAPGTARWAISTAGGNSPRWSHRGDEVFYLDLRSQMVAAKVVTTPTFEVQKTRVLFDASDFVQVSISRRNYDVAPDDQRFLMVQRAGGAKRGEIVVVEHWLDEIRRKAGRPAR
jgi:serine/threonine-protein kinase